MRKKRLLVIVILLSASLILPIAFSLGLVDVSKLPMLSGTTTPSTDSSPKVFVDPAAIVDETLQSGSYFTVYVNISDVTDLYTWQVNVTWNPAILNVTRIIPGEFLARAIEQTSSEAMSGVVINSTDYANGYTAFAETILGDVAGISGPASGRLASIEFEVVGYGRTNITISVGGTLPTMLLDSLGSSTTPNTTDGYFSNVIPGDLDYDGYIGPIDLSMFGAAYGKHEGDARYNPDADLDPPGDPDGYIGPIDFSYFGAQYGKHV